MSDNQDGRAGDDRNGRAGPPRAGAAGPALFTAVVGRTGERLMTFARPAMAGRSAEDLAMAELTWQRNARWAGEFMLGELRLRPALPAEARALRDGARPYIGTEIRGVSGAAIVMDESRALQHVAVFWRERDLPSSRLAAGSPPQDVPSLVLEAGGTDVSSLSTQPAAGAHD